MTTGVIVMRTRLLGAAGAAIVVTLVLAASAMAQPGARTFAQTYPDASALCLKAQAGTLGKQLEPSRNQLLTACATLQQPYASLTSTVTAAEGQYTQTASGQAALVAAACPQPLTKAEHPNCHTARLTARATDSEARLTRHDAVVSFHASVEANRVAFWATVKSLR
jgi:hypothetical protein